MFFVTIGNILYITQLFYMFLFTSYEVVFWSGAVNSQEPATALLQICITDGDHLNKWVLLVRTEQVITLVSVLDKINYILRNDLFNFEGIKTSSKTIQNFRQKKKG